MTCTRCRKGRRCLRCIEADKLTASQMFAEEPCFDCEGDGCYTCNDTGLLYTQEAIRLQLQAAEDREAVLSDRSRVA